MDRRSRAGNNQCFDGEDVLTITVAPDTITLHHEKGEYSFSTVDQWSFCSIQSGYSGYILD
jgi:hypothetical protein